MEHEIYVYIAIMSAVTLAIKILPLTLIRGEIKNTALKSFLHYVPYVTLAVMTFPAILYATNSKYSGLLALIVGTISAWLGASLFRVAVICCAIVFFSELWILG
ncbi:MAG: AzlD domain-containing protein [Selenomonadaceae bacterium]|nr:AzlD domain-containing protein [Selenomonadaceae bacterium]